MPKNVKEVTGQVPTSRYAGSPAGRQAQATTVIPLFLGNMTGYRIITLALLGFMYSCSEEPQYSEPSESHSGFSIVTSGPRGMGYTDPAGKNFGFRIFRAHVRNDTTVPAELTVNFSANPIKLAPDSNSYVQVFMFPPSMVPEQALAAYNYGVEGIETFLDTGLNKPSAQKITVKPGLDHYLYIGILMYPQDGRANARLFTKGEDLFFEVWIDDPTDSAIIPCGQIVFNSSANSPDYVSAYPFWGSVYDTALKDHRAIKLRPFFSDTLNPRLIETIINKTWPKVQIRVLKTSQDTLYLSIPNSTVLTQQMGTDGAKEFMLSTTYSFTELTWVKYVSFAFEEGDHAVPGVYSRRSWGRK